MDEQLYCGKVVMDSGETWEYVRPKDSGAWAFFTPVLLMLDEEKDADPIASAPVALVQNLRELNDGRCDVVGTVTVAQIQETAKLYRDGGGIACIGIGASLFDAVKLAELCDAALWQPADRIELHAECTESTGRCMMVGPYGIGIVAWLRPNYATPNLFPMVPA